MKSAMPRLTIPCALFLSAVCLVLSGCSRMRGKPGPGPDVPRPEQVVDFKTLYKSNCAACHGPEGRNGVAISLANPLYLSVAGEDNISRIVANGVPDKLMPPFAKSAGGMLTDRQVTAITHGMMSEWNHGGPDPQQSAPPYQGILTGNSEHGRQAYQEACARCHGANGEGDQGDFKDQVHKVGSIVDPTYLALVSDQYLRSIIIAGRPDQGMPDWRSDSNQSLTDAQITDIVSWLASKRTADPGQPYGTAR